MATDLEELVKQFGGTVSGTAPAPAPAPAPAAAPVAAPAPASVSLEPGDLLGAMAAPAATVPTTTAPMSPEQLAASQQPAASTTVTGLAGAATRGLALPAAGAAAGALLGAPFAGVGAVPGAIAGAGAATLAQVVGDPIVSTINSLFGTQYTMPTDAMADLLTRVGVPQARSQAEKIVQATAAGASMAGGTVAAGRAIQTAAGQAAPVTREVGRMLAIQPGLQAVSGAAGGAAGQVAQEMGAGTAGQIAASVAGGLTPLGVTAATRRARRAPAPAPRVEPTFEAPPAAPAAMAPEAPAATPMAAAIPEAPPPAPVPAGAPMGTAMASEVPPSASGAAVPAGDVGEVLNLARKAGGMGLGSTAAKAKLVDMAQVNPEARAAAERLGIDVPFDVLSDNPQVRSAVGLTRALVAGEAEAAWENTVRQSIQRADEISQQFDAAFVAGRPAPGATSQKIVDNLQQTRQTLKSDAKAIYERIDEMVPKSASVDLNNLKTYLDDLRTNLGAAGRMTPQESNLAKMLEKGELTYFGLKREKDLVGQAVGGLKSPYDNMAAGDLKRLYSALAQDQLDSVAALAGEEARRELRAANLLTAKQKALEKRIVGAFGQEIDGSVAQRMQTAISTAAKGDAAAFNRLMKVVPAELQKETLATALASVTAGKAAGRAAAGSVETVFSPAEFTKVYRGLRSNPPVYSQMVKIMGPEWDRTSRDLYEISRRIADAQARIPTTGKANQILGEAAVESLFGKIISSSLAQRAATTVASTVPFGGVIAPDIIGFMAGAKGAGVQKAAKLFASPEFQELAVQSATKGGEPTKAAIRRTAMSKPFSDFANETSLPQSLDARVQYLQSAIQAGRQFDQETQQ
jgi:hypothetical protein